jgi:hypothetical protein
MGFVFFRYVLKKTYKKAIADANKEAEVIKEKKLLEVKEKFLNKKAELEKEVQQRNQKIAQAENKLKQREISLNQRQDELNRRKQEVENNQAKLNTQLQLVQKKEEELEKLQLQEREKLEELKAKVSIIGDIRGKGLMSGCEFVDPNGEPDCLGSLPASGEIAARVQHMCFENKLVMEKGGRHGSVMRCLCALNVSDEDLETMINIYEKVVIEVDKDVKK